MRWKAVLAAVVMVAMGGEAFGHDLNPPPWWGPDSWTDPSQTFQGWDFLTESPTGFYDPDFGSNLNGFLPLEHIPVSPPNEPWLAELDPGVTDPFDPRIAGITDLGIGVVPLSGELIIPINNWPTPNPEKKVWIQVTWASMGTGGTPLVGIEDLQPTGTYLTTPVSVVDTIALTPTWNYSIYEFSIFPNPEFEIVRISGSVYVDQIVVDTWCVPEPATGAVLAACGLLLLARPRR